MHLDEEDGNLGGVSDAFLRPTGVTQRWKASVYAWGQIPVLSAGRVVAVWPPELAQPGSAAAAGEEKQLLKQLFVSPFAISIPPCLMCHGSGSHPGFVCAVLSEKKEILPCLCRKMMILS